MVSLSFDALCFVLLGRVVPLVTLPPTMVMCPAIVMGARAAKGGGVVVDLEEGAAAVTVETVGAATVGFILALTALLLALVDDEFDTEVGIDEVY